MRLTIATEEGATFNVDVDSSMELNDFAALLEAEVRLPRSSQRIEAVLEVAERKKRLRGDKMLIYIPRFPVRHRYGGSAPLLLWESAHRSESFPRRKFAIFLSCFFSLISRSPVIWRRSGRPIITPTTS